MPDTTTIDECSGDVFQASSELRAPKLDCRHSIYLPPPLQDSRDSAASTLRSTMGRSLTEMPFLTTRLQSVIQAMCEATVLLDQYYREMLDNSADEATQETTFQVLANVRVGIQHVLLTLTPEKSTEETTSAALMYRACWLALLIYSDIVLFVTPVQSGIRSRLASELLQCLTLVTEKDPGHCNHFYAWAAILGGVAASTSGSAHLREAYTRVIQRLCGPFLRCRIDAVLERCMQYIWWRVVLDQPARTMLLEATKDTYQ